MRRFVPVAVVALSAILIAACGSDKPSATVCPKATGGDQAFCGSVTVDGAPAPDGTGIRLFAFCNSTNVGAVAETAVTDGGYDAQVPAAAWSELAPCPGAPMYFRVGGRWANETGSSVAGTTQVVNLSVTDPPLIPRGQAAEPSDPRLIYSPVCYEGITERNYLAGRTVEPAEVTTGSRFPIDSLGIEGVTVRVPELGVTGATDVDGCFRLVGFDISEPTLVTLEAERQGYAGLTSKNLILYPGGSSTTAEMRRDRPVVTDGCAFGGPPQSAAQQGVAELCAANGLGPEYILRGCPYDPGRYRQQSGGLRQIMGIVLDEESDGVIGGATVAITEYGLSTTSEPSGCFTFGVFDEPVGAAEPITVEVRASGFGDLTVRNVLLLSGSVGLDLYLTRSAAVEIIDLCRFDQPPKDQIEEARADACDQAGILTKAY
jgi:hypothetical protein